MIPSAQVDLDLCGRLAPGPGCIGRACVTDQAADLLWMLCSFEAFDLLHTGRGMSVDHAANTLADTAERALCT